MCGMYNTCIGGMMSQSVDNPYIKLSLANIWEHTTNPLPIAKTESKIPLFENLGIYS